MDRAKSHQLIERCRLFAIRIITLLRILPGTPENQEIGRQIIRSASSVGANYSEAQHARTEGEFFSIAKISLREAGETVWWLQLLKGINSRKFVAELDELIKECDELCRIFGSISQKSRK